MPEFHDRLPMVEWQGLPSLQARYVTLAVWTNGAADVDAATAPTAESR